MAELEELLQSIFIGLIFAYLLSKLISLLLSFKEGNFSITRESTDSEASKPGAASESDPLGHGDLGGALEADSMIGEVGSVRHESLSGTDDDEDWDNEESTELEDAFSAATMFVAATAADRASEKVSTDVQLQLYGLYKIATEGPCTSPQPSALKMAARAKWSVVLLRTTLQIMLYDMQSYKFKHTEFSLSFCSVQYGLYSVSEMFRF